MCHILPERRGWVNRISTSGILQQITLRERGSPADNNFMSFLDELHLDHGYLSMAVFILIYRSHSYRWATLVPRSNWQSWELSRKTHTSRTRLGIAFSSYVRIRDVALKTCQRRWMIGRSGERASGISVLAARHDDDDDTAINFKLKHFGHAFSPINSSLKHFEMLRAFICKIPSWLANDLRRLSKEFSNQKFLSLSGRILSLLVLPNFWTYKTFSLKFNLKCSGHLNPTCTTPKNTIKTRDVKGIRLLDLIKIERLVEEIKLLMRQT